MNKLVFASVLAIAVSGASLANENIIGRWDCKMVSEYGDFEFELTLNDDSTYTKKTDMFGSMSIDTGNWVVEREELVMKRQKYSKNGEEKDSEIHFRREITSLSDTTLTFQHDDAVTTCTKT